MAAHLRLLNYLSPGLPVTLFEGIAAHLQNSLETPVSLTHETRFSGPPKGAPDPFTGGEADLAFMCAPPFFWCLERGAPVELLGVAPVFDDPRAQGRPVYFSDVLTRADSPAKTFSELRGGSWAYNDGCSLSGYYCLLEHLHSLGEDEAFFELTLSGSHGASLELVASGRASAAAVDSNVWRLADPALKRRLKVLTTWGPFPVQPLVVRSPLEAQLKTRLREVLLNWAVPADLSALGFAGFAPVTPADYAPEAAILRACERQSSSTRQEASSNS